MKNQRARHRLMGATYRGTAGRSVKARHLLQHHLDRWLPGLYAA